MPKKNVYALYSCDIWKMQNSMRLQGIFTSFEKLQKAVSYLIADKTFECSESSVPCKKCAACTNSKTINNTVDFCYIEEVEMNKLK